MISSKFSLAVILISFTAQALAFPPPKVTCNMTVIKNASSCNATFEGNFCYSQLPAAEITLSCGQENLAASDFANDAVLEYYPNSTPPNFTATTVYECVGAAWKAGTVSSQNGTTSMSFTCG